jgi:tripartite-type tricarboxylate transporter receptor subunit TctC
MKAVLAVSLALVTLHTHAAQGYPTRPIRVIVGSPPAGGGDIMARLVAQPMGVDLGQQVVVDNRSGAGGTIGADIVAKAPGDGHTLLFVFSGWVVNPTLYPKLPYDTLRDFAPITQTVANPLGAVVNPASGLKSIKDVVARAKAEPGKLNYGSFGIGNLTHLMGVLLSQAADIKMTHVPYRGQTPEITDILGGQIPFGFTTTAGVSDLVESGKLNLISVFDKDRDEQFPKVPTPTEEGYPGVVVVGWAGLLAPAGTPKPIIDKLYAGMAKALAMPDVKDAILKQGSKAVASKGPEDFRNFIKSEMEKFHPVIKAAGLEGTQ